LRVTSRGLGDVYKRQAYAGDDALFGMPYALPNDTTGYSRAAVEIHSPLLANKVNIEEGKRLYMIFCQHCHGKEGHGDGAISKNGLIAGIPDYATKLKDLEEGKMYHTLQFGKGLMGSHASQLNQKERWQILEWVKCLQKGIATPEYDAKDMLKVAAEAAPADSTKK
jgi:mono/diheme cytochrome c family protein